MEFGPKQNNDVISTNLPESIDVDSFTLTDDPNEYLRYNVLEEDIDNDLESKEVVILDNKDDKTPQGNIITTFDFLDDKKKGIFFDSSEYKQGKEIGKIVNVLDVLDFYQKEGKYIDVYLPITNVAVRIYEFNNYNIALTDFLEESRKDFLFKIQANMLGTQTRKFVDLIFKNSEFLVSDADTLQKSHFELVSAQDIPLLILGGVLLLTKIYEYTKGTAGQKPYSWEDTCNECGTPQEMLLDLDDLLRSQYTKEIIDYANAYYDPNDTLDANLKRSKKIKAKGVKYTKGNKGIETIFFLKDPEWARAHEYDNIGNKFLIDKYSESKEFKAAYDANDNNWLFKSQRDKLIEIYKFLDQPDAYYLEKNIELNSIQNLRREFLDDTQYIRIIRYLYSIKIINTKELDENGKPKVITDQDVSLLSLNQKIEIIKSLPTDTLLRITEQIEALSKYGIRDLHYKFTCKKCKKENEVPMDPIFLVFSVLRNLTEIEDSE